MALGGVIEEGVGKRLMGSISKNFCRNQPVKRGLRGFFFARKRYSCARNEIFRPALVTGVRNLAGVAGHARHSRPHHKESYDYVSR